MNTRLLFGLLWLTPTLCFGALSTTTSYFLNVEALTNVVARSAVRGLTGVLTNGITAGASTFTGQVGFSTGSAGAPSIQMGNDTTTGLFDAGSNILGFSANGAEVFRVSPAAITLSSASTLGWNFDTILVRDGAANTLALRNSTAAQTFNIYNTYTDASNYERGEHVWSSNIYFVGTRRAGTGSIRSMRFMTGGTSHWEVQASTGHFLAVTDNTYDIGASGATRPRNVYVAGNVDAGGFVQSGGNIVAASGSAIRWSSRTQMASSADGIVRLINNAANDFDRLQFGGTTASFPALKRSTTNIVVRLADDSTDTGLTADALNLSKTITAGGTTGNQTINKSSGSVNFAAAGQSITVTSDHCTANSIIMATVGTDDTTAKSCIAVPGAGSFVLKLNAAATAETKVMFLITN